MWCLHNVTIYSRGFAIQNALTFSLNFTTIHSHSAVSSAYYSVNNMDPDQTASGFDSFRCSSMGKVFLSVIRMQQCNIRRLHFHRKLGDALHTLIYVVTGI